MVPSTAGAASVTMTAGSTVMVSTDANGNQVAGFHASPAASANGNFVAFVTDAAFDPNDTSRGTTAGINNDVYRKDLSTGAVILISRAGTDAFGNALPADGPSGGNDFIDISDDGATIVYESTATNLVPSDTNNAQDVFATHVDPTTGAISTVLLDSGTAGQNTGAALGPSLSADGTKAAFVAYGSLNGDGHSGLYVRDLAALSNPPVWLSDAAGSATSISGSGNAVAYLASGSGYQINVTNLSGPGTVASTLNYSAVGNYAPTAGLLGPNSLNSDATSGVFFSNQTDLVSNDTNGKMDVFRNNDGGIDLASADSCGVQGNDDSGLVIGDAPIGAISSDGNRVVFTSNATNLDATTTSASTTTQSYIHYFTSSVTAMMSVSQSNAPGDASTRATTISSDGTAIAFATNAGNILTPDTNTSDVFEHFVSTTTPPAVTGCAAPTPSNAALKIGDGSVSPFDTFPGFSELAASDIPTTAIPLSSADEVSGAPLRSVDIASSPLRSVPLRSVPLRSVPLRSVPLRSVTLSDLPLTQGTWEAILGTLNPNPFAGVPLQSITLDAVLDAFDAQPAATGINNVTLGNVDLSSTPLRSVALASVFLGSTPLRSVPVPGSSSDVFTNWCTLLQSLGFSCTSLQLTQDSPILALDLEGVPLRSVPLRSVPLRSVDLSSAPLRSVPLRSVLLGSIPLGTLPLNKINPASAVVDCTLVNCTTGTLADAFNANAILANVTLGDLFSHVNQADLPGSLAELIDGLIDTTNYPWWQLPLNGLQDYAGANARKLNYTASYDVGGTGAATTTVSVTLPAGFRYVTGSTTAYNDALTEPTVAGEHLTWTMSDTGGTSRSFQFDVYPGFDLVQNAASSIDVTIGATTVSAANQALVNVDEDFESGGVIFTCQNCVALIDTSFFGFGNNSPATAPVIQPNNLVVSHIGTANDVDYFKVPVPPKGTRMQIELGNHSTNTDFDVKMFNDAASSTGTAPLRSVPLRSVPLRSVPLPDQGLDATAGANTDVSPETLNDIPDGTAPLRSVSENRGTANELIATVSDAPTTVNNQTNYYTLQVTAYNGGFSNQPYVLYVKEYAPPPPPVCDARSFPFAGQGTAGSAPSIDAATQTLFLVNQKRLGDTYGTSAAANAISKLNSLAGRSDVKGAVYPVESNATVQAAMDAWDADPCNVEKANDAFTAISSIVDSVHNTATNLKNIVVVGGDDIIPMARVADYTQVSNEQDYAASTLLTTGKGTPIAAAEATQNILTDDPLGDTDPIPWLDHTLYVPDLSVGRLVETPNDIAAQVDQFVAANGTLAPSTSLTTGYDFLADGSSAVNSSLTGISSANHKTLINETWSKADELGALYPSTGSTPDVAALNAHYDHTRSLPALGNSTGDESDLVTTADIAAHPATLNKRLIFTMGCHAGLAMPQAYTDTAAKDADWAQTYLGTGQQAATYFANTGFGYGDTATVALSEELMRQFAMRLDGTMTVGQAATFAKQAYFAQLGAYGPYDEKAMQEATFYGFPFWKIGSGGTPQVPAPAANPAADGDGILSAGITLNSSFGTQTSGGGGTFYKPTSTDTGGSGLPVTGGGVQVTQYRPIEPKTAVDVTPADPGSLPTGTVAHGLLISGLSTHDVPTVPAVARPVIDLTAVEPPPPAGGATFPTNFQTLTSYNGPTGPRQQAVFLTGQFFDDASPASAGGTQRLVDSISGDVKYSNSPDFVPPQLTNVVATLDSGNLTVGLASWDEDPNGGVKHVIVLVRDGSGAWTSHELLSDAINHFSATFPVSGSLFEFFAESEDAAGNVGVTTNKGRYYTAVPAALTSSPAPPSLVTDPGQPNGSNGWYKGTVDVLVQGTPGVTYQTSVDGGPTSNYTGPVPVSGDGTHTVKAFGSDNSSASLVVVIDGTAPSISGAADRAPNANGWYKAPVNVHFTCSDPSPGSGLRTCGPDYKLTLDGANQSVKGSALDWAGNGAGPVTVGPINLDQTPPTVAINGVTEDYLYTDGAVPTPTCQASDSLSGLDGTCQTSLTGKLANGVGYLTFTATAKDKAGNVTTKTAHYRSLYRWDGFLQPINDTAHQVDQSISVFSAGSTVPVKFQLKLADGTIIQANSAPLFLTPAQGAPMSLAPNESTLTTTASLGNTFTWDAVNQQYIYNWKTTKKMAGSYWQIGVQLDDGSIYTVIIGLK